MEDEKMDTEEDFEELEDDDGDWGDFVDEDTITQDDCVDVPTHGRQAEYTILTTSEVRDKEQKRVTEVAELLGLDEGDAAILLRHYRWNQNRLVEEYLENSNRIRKDAGLDPVRFVKLKKRGSLECPQCYDDLNVRETFHLQCNHQSCRSCWKDYLTERVKLGAKCVLTHCNYYQCNIIVPDSSFSEFLDTELMKKHSKFCTRSFIEGTKSLVWCPGPGCENACEYAAGGALEIACSCGHVFCFKCHEDSHRPAPCDWARKWRIKSNSEAENVTWILANTKACIKCHVQIEKNQGCNHMTCRNCKSEFCWLCKGDWKDHGSATGGYYKCNRYEEKRAKNELSDEEKVADRAKNELQKYLHYFQRFDNHDKSMKHAIKTLNECENKMKRLQDLKGGGFNDVQFLIKAVETVIECRRLLKWTYCFGYYIEPGLEKSLFERLQEDLEKYTEHLHELSEKQSEELVDEALRADINNYTRTTEKFRENMMNGIEAGLTADS